jgi:hypothetical protein
MTKECAICEGPVPATLVKGSDYFCWKCFDQWREDVLAKKPWVMYLVTLEQSRRRERSPFLVYIDDGYDVSDSHKLIRGKSGKKEEGS